MSGHDTTTRVELHELMFRLGPEAAAVTTFDGQVLDVNERALVLTGYAREELLGATLPELLEIDPDRRRSFGDEILEHGVIRDFPLEIRQESGNTIVAEVSAQVIGGGDESVLFVIVKDKTARHAVEEALRASEARYRAVVDAQTEFVVRWQPDGTRTFVNEAYCTYFGGTREEFEGTSFLPLVAPEYRDAVLERIEAITPENPVSTGRHVVRRADESTGWQEWTDRGLYDEEGTLVELLSVGRDVTDLENARQALGESRNRLRATLKALPDLIFRHSIEGEILAMHVPRGAEHLVLPGVEVGATVQGGMPPDVAEEWLQALRLTDASGDLQTLEYSLTLPTGHRHFECRMVPVDVGDVGQVLTIVRDVTEPIVEREARREAQTLFQAAWEQSPAFILVIEPDGTISYANPVLLAEAGLRPEGLVGQSMDVLRERAELQFPDRTPVPTDRLPILRAIAGETVRGEEFRLRLADGKDRWVVANAAPVWGPDGTVVAGIAVSQEITDLKQEAERRRASDRLFRSFFEQIAAPAAALELDGTIRRINPAFERLLGHAEAQLVGQSIFDFMDCETRPRSEALLAKLADGTIDAFWREEKYIGADDSSVWVHSSVNVVRDRDGEPDYVVGLAQDISERKRLAADLVDVAMQERERLGRDLHDGLGQELTGAGLLAKSLERDLTCRGDPGADAAREIRAVLQNALSQARFLAAGLVSLPLRGGMGVALADLAQNASELFRVPIELKVDETTPVEDEERALQLYQICREAVTNAVRHGEAHRIRIELISSEAGIRLAIVDDGIGIPREAQRQEGIGLRSMRSRALQLGGELEVRRRRAGGTQVVCTVASIA